MNCANSSIDGDNEKTAFEDDVEVLDGEWDGPVDGRPRSNFGKTTKAQSHDGRPTRDPCSCDLLTISQELPN